MDGDLDLTKLRTLVEIRTAGSMTAAAACFCVRTVNKTTDPFGVAAVAGTSSVAVWFGRSFVRRVG